jgi:hypothetical protein
VVKSTGISQFCPAFGDLIEELRSYSLIKRGLVLLGLVGSRFAEESPRNKQAPIALRGLLFGIQKAEMKVEGGAVEGVQMAMELLLQSDQLQ